MNILGTENSKYNDLKAFEKVGMFEEQKGGQFSFIFYFLAVVFSLLHTDFL